MKTQQSSAEKAISQQRIRELIAEYFDGNQQEFANRCNVPKASVSQYVHGSNAPGNVTAARIAKELDIDPLWVMGFGVPKRRNSESKTFTLSHREEILIEKYRVTDEAGKCLIDYIAGVEASRCASSAVLAAHHESDNFTEEQKKMIAEFKDIVENDNS